MSPNEASEWATLSAEVREVFPDRGDAMIQWALAKGEATPWPAVQWLEELYRSDTLEASR